ncbi:hypothetical protein GTP55_21550 [Duganella sp. FT109W]|jgi:hypothetical protein|uniref:Uncharacterized protein n=2 Tax=Duganella TaxID=75654 RepID=A0A7X4KJ18_9BURK|nr:MULTISPECIES: hypothetical protein [Duganella]MYM74857.1 hypothetical protein [Duganella margarita]MYN41948.1 hypothetical protein [Duganella margarita]QJD92275.1 hypothetical protein HH213_20560 [Duganella dendranthematis]
MPASHDTYTRTQGLKKTYEVEYTALRYKISLGDKVLKDIELGLQSAPVYDPEIAWRHAVADIENLRGMTEQ